MKKLTKTQKTILKKKILKGFNVVGLVVGGLSFLVVLYALISGSINSNNSSESIDLLEEVPPKPNFEQRALTPPSADFSYYYSSPNQRFVAHNDFNFDDDINAGDNYAVNDKSYLAFNSNGYTESATYNHYHNTDKGYYISSSLSFYKTPTLFGSLSASNTDAVPKEEYIQLSPVSDAQFQISIDNKSPYNLKFNLDISSSGTNLGASASYRTNNNQLLTYSNIILNYNTLDYSYFVPSFMKTNITIYGTTNTNFLITFDAFYLTSLGVSASYSNGIENNDFYEEGYDTGYGVGYADGYDEGIDIAYDEGYEDGYFDGLEVDYDKGYTDGWADGHKNGIDEATKMGNGVESAFDLIYKGAQSIDKILSINVFGSITLGMLIFTPLIIGIAFSVIKIIKG